MQTLEDWDRAIAPKLRNIEISARWMSHYIDKIRDNVDAMSMAPAWASRAIADAKTARQELASVLKRMDAVIATYDEKKSDDV